MGMLNRRGEATDIITFSFWLFVIALVLIFIVFAFNEFFSLLPDTALGEDNNSLAAINSSLNITRTTLPMTYFIIIFGLILGMMVSSFFIREHPIFIPIYIFVAIASVIVSVALGNAWGNLQDVEEFQETLEINSILSSIDLVMSNIVIITLAAFILSLIIVFAKPIGSGQQGGATPY